MKKVILMVIIGVLLLIPFNIEAKTVNDLYKELADLEAKYNNANSKKKLTQSEINALGSEINSINASIASAQTEITKAQQEIEDSYKKIQEKKQETDDLLKFLQVSSGSNSYLEYLFAAESYTDFIYRYAIVSQMSEKNKQLMDELEVLIADLEKKQETLAKKEKDLEVKRREVNNKRDVLRVNLSELTEEGTTIEQDIADLKKDIDYYTKKLGCSRNQDISKCISQPKATGWSYPLASGCVSSEYTPYRTDWSPGSSHHGIDLTCVPEGTKVYAAASGTVARVVKYTGGRSCGGNMVFIYHNVNGVKYTSVYMHLLSISTSYGATVDSNTVIGTVGGGSTAESRGDYDYCTTGTHLHFGLASGHVAVGFNSYSFNPRNVYKFPQAYAGYFYR